MEQSFFSFHCRIGIITSRVLKLGITTNISETYKLNEKSLTSAIYVYRYRLKRILPSCGQTVKDKCILCSDGKFSWTRSIKKVYIYGAIYHSIRKTLNRILQNSINRFKKKSALTIFFILCSFIEGVVLFHLTPPIYLA